MSEISSFLYDQFNSVIGNVIAAFVIIIISSLCSYIMFRLRKSKIRILTLAFYGNKSRAKERLLKQQLKRYVQQLLYVLNSDPIKSRKFVKLMKANKDDFSAKTWILLAPPGYGKSILSQYAAYRCAKYKKKANTLEEMNVKYINLASVATISVLNDKINNNPVRQDSFLILDSFDEFRVLRDEDSYVVLDKIIEVIGTGYDLYKRILITSRKEPFYKGISDLESVSLNVKDVFEHPIIFKLQVLDRKQIEKLYEKIGGSKYTDKEGYDSAVPCEIKGGNNKKRIRSYLDEYERQVQYNNAFNRKGTNKISPVFPVFSTPLIISYADILFSAAEDKELLTYTNFTVIEKLFEYWTLREFSKYHSQLGKASRSEYVVKVNNAVDLTIDHLLARDQEVKENKEKNYYTRFEIADEELRHLHDKLVEDTGEKKFSYLDVLKMHAFVINTSNKYEFIHKQFLEFFMVRYLATADYCTTFKYLVDPEFDYLKGFYIEYITRILKERVIEIQKNIEWYAYNDKKEVPSLNSKCVEELLCGDYIKLKDVVNILIEDVISLFPLIKVIKYKNFKILSDNFDKLTKEKYLDLSNQGIKGLLDLSIIDEVNYINVRNNHLIDVVGLLAYGIRKIDFYGIKVEPNQFIGYKMEQLGLSIENINQLESWLNEFPSCNFRFEMVNDIKLYLHLAKKKKLGAHIKLNTNMDYRLINKWINNRTDVSELLNEAMMIYELQYDSHPEEIATFKIGSKLGIELTKREKYEEGEMILRKTYERLREFESYKPNTYRIGSWLGSNLTEQKKYEEAVEVLREVYIRLKELEPDKSNTFVIGYGLGETLTELEKYEEGEEVLREVYNRLKELEPDNPETFAKGFKLSCNLTTQRKYEEGEEVLREVYKRVKYLEPDNTNSYSIGYKLGYILTIQMKYEEGEEVLREAFKKHKELAPYAKSTFGKGYWLGRNLTEQKKYEEGEEVLQEVYNRLMELDPDNQNIFETCFWLGQNLTKQKKYKEGEEFLRKAEKGLKDLDIDNVHKVNSSFWLGYNLNRQANYEEGERVLQKVYRREKELYPDIPDTYITAFELGSNLTIQKKYEEGEGVFREAYERSKVLFPDHPDTYSLGFKLGRNLAIQEKYDSALKILLFVYEKQMELLGEKDTEALETNKFINQIKIRM